MPTARTPRRNLAVVAAALFLMLTGSAAAQAQAPEVRACWLTQYQYLNKSEAQLRTIAQNIKNGNMNTVYIAVYSGGTVYWPSQAYKAAGGTWGSSSVDWTDYLIDVFHDEGLKVGAWFEYGLALSSVNHPIALAHPDWLARDQNNDPVTGENGGFVFISPASPGGTDMINAMVRELAENYNFDDIQLDRFRWGRKTTGREYGYEAVCAALYQSTFGTNPPTNVNNAQWVTFREGLVNSLMQRCYNTIKAVNPRIVVSSAPTGSYGITQHLQRWSAWVNGGYMDLVMPQMYMTTLSAFQTEFNTQRNQAPAHINKLGVGYRAQDDADWSVVSSQLNYARSFAVPHGCLWVYHQYTAQIAIQDEINNLPRPGQPWALSAYNPFVSERMLQIVIDNRDTLGGQYVESAPWGTSAQPDFFRFDSKVVAGGTPAPLTATFSAEVPKPGRYDVYAWHTASTNRNPAAQWTIHRYGGDTSATVDQRTLGGRWTLLGRYVFDAAAQTPLLTVSNAGSSAAEYTSADAVKLVLVDYALGDADGDGQLETSEFNTLVSCMNGPTPAALAGTCPVFDFNDDADVDLLDVHDFQRRFGN